MEKGAQLALPENVLKKGLLRLSGKLLLLSIHLRLEIGGLRNCLRRYSLEPYRYARQRYTTVMVRVPEAFVNEVLWPQYEALNKELQAYLAEATEKIISEEVYKDTTEAKEIVQLLK